MVEFKHWFKNSKCINNLVVQITDLSFLQGDLLGSLSEDDLATTFSKVGFLRYGNISISFIN